MEIIQGIKAIDKALHIESDKALVLSDMHFGYEESLRKGGILIPKFQYKDVIEKLDYIFQNAPPVEKVILNGDIKHEFGRISDQEWSDILKFFDYFIDKGIQIIIVKGNHDPLISPVAKKRSVIEVKEYRTEEIQIIHGDEEPTNPLPIIIMGHEHPAITLREESKAEKYKCFVKGRYKDSLLIVQPSFNPLTVGMDVLQCETLGPIITDIKEFDVYVVDEKHEILFFGKIKNL